MSEPRLLVSGALVWLDRGTVLLQRRSLEARHGAGLLELPGGKVERGEHPRAALARELVEEWGARALEFILGPVAEILHHVYPTPGPEVVLCVFHVDGSAWRGDFRQAATLLPGAAIEAFSLGEIPVAACLAADRDFIQRLADGLVDCPFP